jgi:hypothetical protein
MMKAGILFKLCVAVLLFLQATVYSQQPPTIGYAFPATLPAGSTIEVQLGGYDWTPDTQFFVLDNRVEIEVLAPPGKMLFPGPPHWFGPKAGNKAFMVPREVTVRLTIPENMPPGPIGWRAANANGVSPPLELLVTDSHDAIEEELGSSNDSPQQLPTLPCTVFGRLKQKEEVDQYRFVSPVDGLITCSVSSQGFGFGLNAAVMIYDDAGNLISDAADTQGQGLRTTLAVKSGAEYLVTLSDIDYRGNRSMVYRLSFETTPRVVATVPAAGQRGASQKITLIGYGLKTGAPVIESVERDILFAGDTVGVQSSVEFNTPAGTVRHKIPLSDHAELIEQRDEGQTQTVALPGAVTGRLEHAEQHDTYTFETIKGDEWDINVAARTIGSTLDVNVAVVDVNGKTVASADDVNGSTDAFVRFKAAADGKYTVRVADVSGRQGEPASIYRVSFTRPKSSFAVMVPDSVELMHGEAPPEIPKKRQKGKEPRGLLYVDIVRPPDLDQDVKVDIEGLPEGTTVPDDIVIPAEELFVAIPLSTSDHASSFASLVTVTCTAAGSKVSKQLLVAPIMKPRANVRPLYPDAGRTVHRGATYDAPVVVSRIEEFSGEVCLQMAARPDRVSQGIFGAPIRVPPHVSQTNFSLFLPEWVQIDRTSRIVLNTVVEVPDSQGAVRTLVNRMQQRITMNVEGTLLTVSTSQHEVTAQSGRSLEVPVQVFRSPKLRRDVRVTLVAQDGQPAPLEVASVMIPVAEASAVLRVPPDHALLKKGETIMKLQAVAEDGTGIIAMASTPIVIMSP